MSRVSWVSAVGRPRDIRPLAFVIPSCCLGICVKVNSGIYLAAEKSMLFSQLQPLRLWRVGLVGGLAL